MLLTQLLYHQLVRKVNHLQKLTLPAGATITQLCANRRDQLLLMASDAGYGFICKFSDLITRNKAGKTLISLPENAQVLPPLVIETI